jgi:glycosyltransferase involved in cell wall biosynthesis
MQLVNVGVNLAPSRGGIYRTVASFARAFVQSGYSSHILSFGCKDEGAPDFCIPCEFIQTSRLPVLRQYYYWHGASDKSFRRKIGTPDLVFIHGLFYHAVAAAAEYCLRKSIPYVIVSHGSLDPYVFTYRRLRKQVWTSLYRRLLFLNSSAVVFSTGEEATKAAKWTDGGRTAVIPWPVDFVPDYSKVPARARILHKFGLPPHLRVALFCGRLDPIKRPLETIREFKATKNEEWVLLLVGAQTDRLPLGDVEAACREGGPRCIYAGPSYGEELRDYFRAADLFILWSHKENFSHVTVEALACGVPVFLSRNVDIWRDIEPARCSFLAPDGQDREISIKTALSGVLSLDRDELAAAGLRGRDWVRRELSNERFTQRLADFCKAVIAT